MEWNRTRYDPCEYKVDVRQSTSPLAYQLNPLKFENCFKCRNQLGLLGGQDVSLSTRNIVDVESDLSGRSHAPSRQACGLYMPQPKNGRKCKHEYKDTGIPWDCQECQEEKIHLRPCQMTQYRPRPVDVGYSIKQPTCDELKSTDLRSRTPLSANEFTTVSDVKPYAAKTWQSNTGLATY